MSKHAPKHDAPKTDDHTLDAEPAPLEPTSTTTPTDGGQLLGSVDAVRVETDAAGKETTTNVSAPGVVSGTAKPAPKADPKDA